MTKFTTKHSLYLFWQLVLVLVGIILMLLWADNLSAAKYLVPIGGSVVATGLAGMVLFLKVWLDQREFQRLADIRAAGFSRIFATRAGLIKDSDRY